MHWRLQKIMHGLSHFRHALTDKLPPAAVQGPHFSQEGLRQVAGVSVATGESGLLQVTQAGHRYTLRTGGSDAAVFHEIFVQGEYAPLWQFLQLNDIAIETVVDVGANIGLAARYFLQHLSPRRMLCLEPFGSNVAMAHKNLEGYPQASILQKALWPKNIDSLHLHRHFRDGHDWSIAAREKEGSLEIGTVEGITGYDILSMPGFGHIDLLKIDIEGGEQKLFDPAADTGYLQQVQVVCVELHKEIRGYARIFNTFRRHGFVLFETGSLLIGQRKTGRSG